MEIKTYRAKTMRDALELVRRELGPSAAVLHTRELNSGLVRRMLFGRQVRSGRVGGRQCAEPAAGRGGRTVEVVRSSETGHSQSHSSGTQHPTRDT